MKASNPYFIAACALILTQLIYPKGLLVVIILLLLWAFIRLMRKGKG